MTRLLKEQIDMIKDELADIARVAENKLIGEYNVVIGEIDKNGYTEQVLLLINNTERYFNIDFDANIKFKEDLAEKIKNNVEYLIKKESFKYQERDTMLDSLREVEKEIKDI